VGSKQNARPYIDLLSLFRGPSENPLCHFGQSRIGGGLKKIPGPRKFWAASFQNLERCVVRVLNTPMIAVTEEIPMKTLPRTLPVRVEETLRERL
jgi:hypothetical protein